MLIEFIEMLGRFYLKFGSLCWWRRSNTTGRIQVRVWKDVWLFQNLFIALYTNFRLWDLLITKFESQLRHMDSSVVSHSALNIGTSHHTLGSEFMPWWQKIPIFDPSTTSMLFHDLMWFICFDIIICLSNLSCESKI